LNLAKGYKIVQMSLFFAQIKKLLIKILLGNFMRRISKLAVCGLQFAVGSWRLAVGKKLKINTLSLFWLPF